MNKCREQFEEYCKKFNIRPEGDYAKDVYEFWQAAWNLRPSTASAPKGWKLVPVVPTIEMIEEGNNGFRSPDSRRHTVSSCYKAMLSAAPTPPVSEDRKDAEHVPLKPASAEDMVVYQQIVNNFNAAMQEDKA